MQITYLGQEHELLIWNNILKYKDGQQSELVEKSPMTEVNLYYPTIR